MVSRKHRYTLFLGYGTEAESLLKTFEQSKCSLGFNTNILFIKFLLEFHKTNSQNQSNSEEQTNALNTSIEKTSKDDVLFSNNDDKYSSSINHIDFKNDTVDEVQKNTKIQDKTCVFAEKEQEEQNVLTKDITASIDDASVNKRKNYSLQQRNKNKNYEENNLGVSSLTGVSQSLKVLKSAEENRGGYEDVTENTDVAAVPNKIRKIEEIDAKNFESSEEVSQKVPNCKEIKCTEEITQTQPFFEKTENTDFAVSTESEDCRFEKHKNKLSLQNSECKLSDTISARDILLQENLLSNTLIPDSKSSKDAFTIPR